MGVSAMCQQPRVSTICFILQFLESHFFLGMKSPNVHPSSSPTPEPGDFSLQVFRGRSWGIMELARLEFIGVGP